MQSRHFLRYHFKS